VICESGTGKENPREEFPCEMSEERAWYSGVNVIGKRVEREILQHVDSI